LYICHELKITQRIRVPAVMVGILFVLYFKKGLLKI